MSAGWGGRWIDWVLPGKATHVMRGLPGWLEVAMGMGTMWRVLYGGPLSEPGAHRGRAPGA